jgi:hypothetical protein
MLIGLHAGVAEGTRGAGRRATSAPPGATISTAPAS